MELMDDNITIDNVNKVVLVMIDVKTKLVYL